MNQQNDYTILASLCNDLGEVEDQLTELNAERERLRAAISEVVERLGGKAELRGFGTLQIASPTIVASYDRKGVDQLVSELRAAGNDMIADAIEEYRKETMRTGGLRIMRERSE